MVDENILLRNSRHLLLNEFNEDSIKFLLESRILIVGAGGLGCPAALYLATAGVKNIRWVDPDKVDISNLPRQILFSENDLNVPKVIVGKRILNKIVPAVDVDAIEERADETNLNKLISGCNIVLDCTDRFKTRHLINKYCVKNKIPLVIGSAVGWSGQLMVVNSSEQNTACYACVFEENQEFTDDPCGAFGIFSPLVGTVGLLQAGEAIKTLLKINQTTGKLLLLNALSLNFDRINLTKNTNCNVCS
ncbi:MAG: molybdopterin biosynthesis protein MoeB [Burkholderiaceae bacterium]|nr:MAG: molybdopterin biosynthesis protein MoeB [Burkholderiaceae bacterium]